MRTSKQSCASKVKSMLFLALSKLSWACLSYLVWVQLNLKLYWAWLCLAELVLIINDYSCLQGIFSMGYLQVVCISIIPHIQFTIHLSLIHEYFCNSPLLVSIWLWIKSVQGYLCNLNFAGCLFEYECCLSLTQRVVEVWHFLEHIVHFDQKYGPFWNT